MAGVRIRRAWAGAAVALATGGALISAPAAGAAESADAPAPAEVSPYAAQTIDNIGASGAWWVNDLAQFSPAVQARVAALLFDASGRAGV